MKAIFLLSFLFTLSFYSFGQIMQIGDTAKGAPGNREGEYINEDTKFAHLNYSSWRSGQSIKLDLFVRESMNRNTGRSLYGIEIDGISYTNVSLGTSVNQDFIHGFIDESEVDKAIHALEYIKDSLLPTTSKNRIDYFLNMKETDVRISAYFDPEDKDGWNVYLSLDRFFTRYTITVKPKDVPDLLTAFKMGKQKIKALK